MAVTEAQYYELVAKLEEIEKATGAYLTDTGVDVQNTLVNGVTREDEDFWGRMYNAAIAAAELRAEEAGITLDL